MVLLGINIQTTNVIILFAVLTLFSKTLPLTMISILTESVPNPFIALQTITPVSLTYDEKMMFGPGSFYKFTCFTNFHFCFHAYFRLSIV